MGAEPTPSRSSTRSCGDCCTRLVDFGVTLRGVPVLEHIDLHMHCGELTALIGPNGAGKTTLLRALIGEVPHTGALRFIHHGRNESPTPLRTGYVPQKLDIDPTSPATVTDLFAGALSRWPLWLGTRGRLHDDVRRQLALVGAEALSHRRLSDLSVGQLQRVMLALALAPNPELLLLDEPVAGMDQAGIGMFYETVSRMRAQYDLSILLVSHDLMAAAVVADRMVLLDRTVLCDGSPREVLLDPAIRRTFGFAVNEQDLTGRPTELGRLPREHCQQAPGGVS